MMDERFKNQPTPDEAAALEAHRRECAERHRRDHLARNLLWLREARAGEEFRRRLDAVRTEYGKRFADDLMAIYRGGRA